MKNINTTFVTECMKLRRSRIFWITILLFMFIPLMMGIMFFVALNPEIGARLGMIGTKASMLRLGNADWESYFDLTNQAVAAIGLVGFGFVTSWVFGREYSDRTIKDILALPVSRSAIVISKFIVVILWCALLAFILILTSILIGMIIAVPGWSARAIYQSVLRFLGVSTLTLLITTPVAFFASYGRGYLLPMAFVILTLILANFIGLVGLGPYFPWAIPGILSAASPDEGMHLIPASYVILIITSIAGLTGTLFWWRYADHH